MKADPRDLVRAHYGTLVDNRTGRWRALDHLAFEGLPIVVLISGILLGVSLPKAVCAGLLTVSGLLSAFFFQTMLQVAQRSMEWADEGPLPGPDTSRRAEFLSQIAANAGYAALVCITTAAIFVAASVARGTALNVLSALGLGMAVHLVLVMLMVLVRVFAITGERLDDARTGQAAATVTPMPKRKTG